MGAAGVYVTDTGNMAHAGIGHPGPAARSRRAHLADTHHNLAKL